MCPWVQTTHAFLYLHLFQKFLFTVHLQINCKMTISLILNFMKNLQAYTTEWCNNCLVLISPLLFFFFNGETGSNNSALMLIYWLLDCVSYDPLAISVWCQLAVVVMISSTAVRAADIKRQWVMALRRGKSDACLLVLWTWVCICMCTSNHELLKHLAKTSLYLTTAQGLVNSTEAA